MRRTFASFGVRIELSLNGLAPRQAEALLAEVLPPEWEAYEGEQVETRLELRRATSDTYDVLIDGDAFVSSSWEVASDVLDSRLRIAIASQSRDRTFIHAGAVGIDGRGLVLPGDTFAGKSTLVAALVRAGATYYSDEYAVLDDEGRLHPYARALSIRTTASTLGESVGADSLGGRTGSGPIEVAAIALTRYERDATWEPATLSPAAGGLILMSHAMSADRRPDETLRVVSRAARGALVLSGPRGDAAETAVRLIDALR